MKKKQNKESSVSEPMLEYEVKTYSIHEAKTNFSKLVKRAAAGETIYIGSFGKPEAVLKVADQRKINAQLRAAACGCMKGEKDLPDDMGEFTEEEIEELFYSTRGLEDFIKK